MSNITFRYETLSGFSFNVNPNLIKDIEELTSQISNEIAQAKNSGYYIGYLSIPVSKRGGGDFSTNIKMGKEIEKQVCKFFGKKLWLLNPGAYNLPSSAKGSDYMAVWADILAGADGNGNDFDLIYFVGPNDVWSFFNANQDDKIGVIEQWVKKEAKFDSHYQDITQDKNRFKQFIKYYALRGSTSYSKGAHDEWNIIVKLNQAKAIGSSIAVYYNGEPIEPGDYDDPTSTGDGYELILR